MGNYEERVARPLSKITGPLIGQEFLTELKKAMLQDRILRALFGEKGERIFVEQLPSYNDTIIPLIELHWKGERWQSQNTRVSGVVSAMIVMPADLIGKTDRFRGIAAAFARWMESANGLFENVSGLIEWGVDAEFKYDNAIQAGALIFPTIDISIPVLFDVHQFHLDHPEVDYTAALDADLLGWITSYGIQLSNDEGTVLLNPTPPILTGQKN